MTELFRLCAQVVPIALGFGLLYILDKKWELDFAWRAPLALVLGMAAGAVCCRDNGLMLSLGSIYSVSLVMLAIPTVVCNAICALPGLRELIAQKKFAGAVLALLLTNTLLAAGLAALWGGISSFGGAFDYSSTRMDIYILAAAAIVLVVIRIRVPGRERWATDPMGVIAAVNRTCHGCFATMVQLVPYAIFCYGAGVTEPEDVFSLLWVLVVTVILCTLYLFAGQGLLLMLAGRGNPIPVFKAVGPALKSAFLTQSGKTAMPVAQGILKERFAVREEVITLAGELGTKLGMPGCAAIWPVTLAVFAGHAVGMTFSPGQYVLMVVAAVVISVLTMGIPGTSMITPLVLFLVMGLPVEVLVLQLSLSGLADLARTPTNVMAATVVALVVDKKRKNTFKR